MASTDRRTIPEATVARLPLYLRSLLEGQHAGLTTISSERLAELAGVNAAKVRKDLSYLGSYGTRGVGYDVEYLLFQMSRELGLTQDWPVVIVGARQPRARPSPTTAASATGASRSRPSSTPTRAVVGTEVHGIVVRHIDDLPERRRRAAASPSASSPRPAAAAQDVADRLVAAGRRRRSSTSRRR